MRAFHSATGDGRRPHVSLRHRPLHMRQHRRCPTPLNLKALISFVLANVLPADYTTTIMLLLFLLLRVRTIRLRCSRSSQRRRRHFKTRQSRPSTSCPRALVTPSSLTLPPSSSPLQLFVWPLTSFLWAFDINGVARRSLACHWIRGCASHDEAEQLIAQKRMSGGRGEGVSVRGREVLPQWSDREAKVVFSDWHEPRVVADAAAAAREEVGGGNAGQDHQSDGVCRQQ